MWAFARLEMGNEVLLKAVSSRASETLREFKAQNMANVAWAFAKSEVAEEAFSAFKFLLTNLLGFKLKEKKQLNPTYEGPLLGMQVHLGEGER